MNWKTNKNLDLLLLFPCFNTEAFYQLKFDWHLGASYIIAYLKEKGISASQFIQRGPINMSNLIERILVHSPKIIGFTCYDTYYYFIKLIAKELKKRRKDILIVVGGPTATFSDELILKDTKAIDICVRKEGEETAAELVDYIKGKIDISKINGISYRYKGKIIRNPDRPFLRGEKNGEELDIFPSPYLSGVLPPGENWAILTSRGCVYQCTYCNHSAMSKWRVSYHSVERVLSELKMISEAHNNNTRPQSRLVSFVDDTFSLNIQRAKEICKRIIEEKISLPFWCHTRADCVDEELLMLMKKANFKVIGFGLESAVPENLRIIKKVRHKGDTDKDLTKEQRFINKVKVNTKKARMLGLDVAISVIIGLPGQSKKQAETTIDFVKKLRPKYYFHCYLTLYPGTPLFNTRKDFGLDIITPKTVLPYKTRFSFDVTKVKILPNAVQRFGLIDRLTDAAINFFSRSRAISQDSIGVPAVFVNNYVSSLDDFVKNNRIKNAITLSPIFFFLQKDRKNIKKVLNELIEKELPVINLLSLKKVGLDKRRLYELIFLTEVIERKRLDFQKLALFLFLPISNLYRKKSAMKIANKDYHRKVILLTLNNQEDQINFKKLLLDNSPLKKLLKHNEADCHLTNQCQWSDKPCPIIKEKSLFIDGEGKNMLCYNGKNIGNNVRKVFSGTPYSKSKVENYFKEIERRRGCRSCPINKSCSKCLFTFPFSEKEFCDIRRNGNTRKLITILEKHNKSNSPTMSRRFLHNTSQRVKQKKE